MFWGDTALDEKIAGRIIPDETLLKIRDLSLSKGVTFIDTAEGYGGGSSEARLGHLGFGTSGHFVATKFLPTLWRWTERSVVRAAAASNKRLGIECCDLLFIHSPIHARNPKVWIKGAARAMRKGHLKALGVSNFNAEQVRAAWKVANEEGIPLIANQIMFSLLVSGSPALQETLRTCQELGIAVVGYGVLGQGLLTAGLTSQRFSQNRLSRRVGLTLEELTPLREEIQSTAVRHGKSMSQVCIQWARRKGVIPLIGTRTVEQLEESIGGLDFTLGLDEVSELDRLALGHSTFNRPPWKRIAFLTFISLLVIAFKGSRLFGSRKNQPNLV